VIIEEKSVGPNRRGEKQKEMRQRVYGGRSFGMIRKNYSETGEMGRDT